MVGVEEGLWVLRGRQGGRYRRGPGGAAATTIRDDGVGGWGKGSVVAVVCGWFKISREFGGEEGAWGCEGLRIVGIAGREGRAGNDQV